MYKISVLPLSTRVCHSLSTDLFYFLVSVQHHLKSFVMSSDWDINFNTETWQMNRYISLLFIKLKENGKITSAPCQQWFLSYLFCYISSFPEGLFSKYLFFKGCFFSFFFFFPFSSSHQHLRAVLQRVQGPGLDGISEGKGHQCSGGRHFLTPRHDGLLSPLHRPTHLR